MIRLHIFKIALKRNSRFDRYWKKATSQKISGLGSDDKKRIESIVNIILTNKNLEDVGYLDKINRILYFIDFLFIKMMAPEFIEEILAY